MPVLGSLRLLEYPNHAWKIPIYIWQMSLKRKQEFLTSSKYCLWYLYTKLGHIRTILLNINFHNKIWKELKHPTDWHQQKPQNRWDTAAFLCLLNGRSKFSNIRGGSRKEGSASSINISRYNMQSLLRDTCFLLLPIHFQSKRSSPSSGCVSQPLQYSPLRHVNVLHILSATTTLLIYTHLTFILFSYLAQLFLLHVYIDTTCNFILNLSTEQR